MHGIYVTPLAQRFPHYRLPVFLAILWTLLITASFAWNANAERQRVFRLAEEQARALVTKDLMYRRWNAEMGGVWVDMQRVKPNPYLAEMVAERDIDSIDGKHLTLVNPSYMSRLVFDIQRRELGIRGRIVSNKPINPDNLADAWEAGALREAEGRQSAMEFRQIVASGEGERLRYLRALTTVEPCLDCHRQQGYRVGDIRGGISVEVELQPFFAASTHNQAVLGGSHGGVWLVGLLGLGFAFRRHWRNEAELQESRSHFRAVMDSALDCIVTMDQEGRIVEYNPMAEQVFGWKRDQILGLSMGATIVPPAFRERHDSGLRRYLESGDPHVLNQRIELTASRRDGLEFPIELAITEARDSTGKRFFTGYIRDIRKRKQAEEALIQAKKDAESANRAKSEFLANMSHEIRTPMNGVIGMTDLLLDTELSAEQREYAEIVRSSGKSLLIIINDILDFSKIEAGQLTMEKLDFEPRALLAEIAAMLNPTAANKGLVFGSTVADRVPDCVRGDPIRLRQVLTNLAGNAIKFTAAGKVSIDVDVAQDEPAHVLLRFSVRDSGIGIPHDKLDRLFKKFSQIDASVTRKYGGTGLGLAISQRLAELMGGEIGVDSIEGKGSTFWFTARLEKSTV